MSEYVSVAKVEDFRPGKIRRYFIEGNEIIGGYVEINVADLDEALSLARSWPGGGAVEIRPTIEQ